MNARIVALLVIALFSGNSAQAFFFCFNFIGGGNASPPRFHYRYLPNPPPMGHINPLPRQQMAMPWRPGPRLAPPPPWLARSSVPVLSETPVSPEKTTQPPPGPFRSWP